MAKLKPLEHLRAEKERAETQLAQEQHQAHPPPSQSGRHG